MAQFEVVTLDHLKEKPEQYSRIRLWGSVGFIVAVVLLGALFDAFSIALLPAALLVLLLTIWVSSLMVFEAGASHHVTMEIRLLMKAVLQTFSSAVKYGFFCRTVLFENQPWCSLHLFLRAAGRAGYSSMVIGGLWTLGMLAEIILFMYMPALLRMFGARVLFWASLPSATACWLLTPLLVDFFIALFLLQWLHALTFGAEHTVSIEWVRRFFTSSSHGQQQVLYAALSFGAGGALGAILCSYLWVISTFWCFAFCALAALLGFISSFWGMRKAKLD